MKLTAIVMPTKREHFNPRHQLHYKHDAYRRLYLDPFVRAARAQGVPIVEPTDPLDAYTMTFYYSIGGSVAPVRVGIDYSDYGPDPEYWTRERADVLLAIKWHPGRKKPFDIPVYPVGMPLCPNAGRYDLRHFLENELPMLRSMKDSARQIDEVFFNKYHFRLIGKPKEGDFPNRRAFQEMLHSSPLSRVCYQEPEEYHKGIASHRWFLNLCGNGDSIDRKLVIACAIGTAIISDAGILDVELPWGGRFEHGKNVWIVSSVEEMEEAKRSLDLETVRRLSLASRDLYDRCLSPDRVAKWIASVARSRIETEVVR